MAKRSSEGTDGAAAFRKRQRLTYDVPSGEDIVSSEQLRILLTFDQDMRNARHGLQSFKRLLDDIISDHDDRTSKLSLLQEYLSAIKPRDTGDDAVHLPEIMKMWSFAIQANNDGVMSAVAVVLALLLQVLAGSLHLVPYGTGICQTLLQDTQLNSLSRNLSAERSKAFIISPTLRLLREAVCLDGGIFAKRIVRARAHTFAYLSRNLELGSAGENTEDSRKASIRSNAVRFFLSCLKYLHSEGRKELLLQRDLFPHLTYMISKDPPDLVLEILDHLKSYVSMDGKIPREVKSRVFNIRTLMRLLSLYTYTHPGSHAEDQEHIPDKAHGFLTYVCTTSNAGLLFPYKGLYPKQSGDELSTSSVKPAGVGESADPWEGRFRDGVPIYNIALSQFAAKLRPWSSLKHCELLVAMFTAAPELISDYLDQNQSFTFEPKLSMTWVGYATFLFQTMMIPLPVSFGDAARCAVMPPPTSIILDNIIPRPINQKVLVRCLSPQSHLTSFFATRMLVAALEKLSTAMQMLREQSRPNKSWWSDASRRVMDSFCQRIPDMKEIVRCYKNIPGENIIHRTLASRLLRLYYETIPQVALSANFDVSPFFADVLQGLERNDGDAERMRLGVLELENLVSIASYSPGMRWFSKLESLGDIQQSSSPFTALLKLLCSNSESASLFDDIQGVLGDVSVESQILKSSTALRPLLQALRCASDTQDSDTMAEIWSFLGDCVSRCATSPIKYLEPMRKYSSEANSSPSQATIAGLSLLDVVIAEQTRYALSAGSRRTAGHLATFVSLYFNAVQSMQGGSPALTSIYSELEGHFSSVSSSLKPLGNIEQAKVLKRFGFDSKRSSKTVQDGQSDRRQAMDQKALAELLDGPVLTATSKDATALSRWAAKSVEDMIEDGWAASLVRLLTSEHIHLRKESLTSILKMAAAIKASSHEDKTQIWLLLSEVAESSRTQVDTGPVPSAFVAFTIHALEVVKNPLHPLYAKVNSYLTRSPVWGLDKLPLAHDILHGTPSEDDRYYTELTWLLTYLLDSLKTRGDLDVFHKKLWLEKLLALASNPFLRSALRTRLLKIIYRATCIESGSTTLMTRFGIMSWLDAHRASTDSDDDAAPVYEALMVRAWETCDQERVGAWSKGGAQQLLAKDASARKKQKQKGKGK